MSGVSRRGLLGGAAAGAAAAAATLGLDAARADVTPAPAAYAFEGPHQAGILTPAQRSAAYVALDVTAATRPQLAQALRTLTDDLRFLTAGGTPPDAGLVATNDDNGILGPQVPADGLTVTVSVGASLFDHRFGLGDRKPRQLRAMDVFDNDRPDPARTGGDLLLQICADNQDTVLHALRQVLRDNRGAFAVRWRQDGFVSPSRPDGAPRNLLGFKDGTANAEILDDQQLVDELVWVGADAGEPAWAVGGSYHVVRLIRMFVEFWDRVSIREQQRMIGRDRTTGAPLTMTHETDPVSYERDSTGDVIPFDAHIRLANPRDGSADRSRMLRRGYSYDAGIDANGQLDEGLIFTTFNADLDRQFVAVQKRLTGEPLEDYISPFGGGYFFALPGVSGQDDWLGRGLLA
ncbi:MAG TPA: iron uptake transporter deferrochelatase/peroxidase subunit [Nocardioides sp.]|nr:iron uptake transporter deferrochelatase/peroxidase subunit [Nocardioides sp.]